MPQGRISDQSMQLRGKRFVNEAFMVTCPKIIVRRNIILDNQRMHAYVALHNT